MGLLTTILLSILGIGATVAVGLLKDEFKDWMPTLTARVLQLAINRAPKELHDQYAEEWPVHVAEYPGNLTKMYVALGCLLAAGRLKPWTLGRAAKYMQIANRLLCLLGVVAIGSVVERRYQNMGWDQIRIVVLWLSVMISVAVCSEFYHQWLRRRYDRAE